MARRKYTKEEIKLMIQMEAVKQGVDPRIALAVAEQESGFNPYAENKGNGAGRGVDQGVMQINNKWHKLKDPFDPQENIAYGIKHLKGLIAGANGNIARALSNYNAGAGAVGKARAQGDNYAKLVLGKANKFSSTTGAAAPINTSPDGTPRLEGNVSNEPAVSDAMLDLYSQGIRSGQQGVQDIANNPYKFDTYVAMRNARALEAANDRAMRAQNAPMRLTPQEVANIQQPFGITAGAMQNMVQQQANTIKQMADMDTSVTPYVDKLQRAYDQLQSQVLAANPYNRMVQAANLTPEERERYATMSAISRQNANAYGIQNPTDLGQNLRDISFYKNTGLTPEQFVAGGQADYNMMANLGTQKLAQVESLYNRGLINANQAQQLIAGITNNFNANMVSNTANAAAAVNNAQKLQLELAKAYADEQKGYRDYTGALDPVALQEQGSTTRQNIASGASMYNTGMHTGANMANNYNTGLVQLQKGDASGLPTFQQIGSTVLNAAGQSQDPTALNNALSGYLGGYIQQGGDPNVVAPYMNFFGVNNNGVKQ